MPRRRFLKAADLPPSAPVFPLNGAILLPRSILPLNVFEPRYLEMVDDALSGNRLMVIVQPERGQTDPDSPPRILPESPEETVPLRSIGCVGRITAYQETEDGRVLITLLGLARCTLKSEVPVKTPYRQFVISAQPYSEDFEAGHGSDSVDREALLKGLKAYLEKRNMQADWSAISRSSTESLVNGLSIISPYGPEEKQALLEAKDLKSRAEVLLALAEMDIATGPDGGASKLQ
ncbi:MAG: hypothetical protein RL291_290 [Pseudomonadota bacterium]